MALGAIVASKAMTIKEAKFEGAVAQLIRDWAIANPAELTWLDKYVRALRREGLYMGQDGSMAKAAEIPQSLNALMCKKIHPHWLRHNEIARVFFRHFRVGMVRPTDKLDFEK